MGPQFEKIGAFNEPLDLGDADEMKQCKRDLHTRDIAICREVEMEAMQPSSTSRSTTKQPRETGYGDFCFGRITAYDRRKGVLDAKEWTQEEFLAGSSNASFEEIGAFQRTWPFPFFKLPLEIRRNIIKQLINPFFSTCNKGNAEVILWIDTKRVMDPEYEGTFEEYQARLLGNDEEYTMTPKQLKIEKHRWTKAKNECVYESKHHPDRSQQYEVFAHVYKGNCAPDVPAKDFPMLELIRHLSNVSTHFRRELGDIFAFQWKRVSIKVPLPTSHSWELVAFLQGRPAIHKGIRSLSLDIDLEIYYPFDKTCRQFVNTFQYLSSTLHLEQLHLDIHIHERNLSALFSGYSWLSFLPIVRSLNVSRDFILDISITTDKVFGFGGQAHANYCRRVEGEALPKIRELLMPDTLRRSEQKTEIEKYLCSRPTLPGSASNI